jgi:hypothetical protein
MIDSHFRLGGAAGSNLQSSNCAKISGTVSSSPCIAGTLMLHLTKHSSAYLENTWLWAADRDIDSNIPNQLNVLSARGILVESEGPTWIYGTSSSHHTLYQYQIVNAANVVLGSVQAEPPHYQPVPKAPTPFSPGLFREDPWFRECQNDTASLGCAAGWGLRIIDSTEVYILGAGKLVLLPRLDSRVMKTPISYSLIKKAEQNTDIFSLGKLVLCEFPRLRYCRRLPKSHL